MFNTERETEASEVPDKRQANTLQAETESERKALRLQYGYFWLAIEVAKYTNTTFFAIMDRSAIEVFSVSMILRASSQYNSLKND